MEEKTYEELVDMHKEITNKIQGLGAEDLERQKQEIQEQIRELEKRHLDLCMRKEDKEAETKELFEKLEEVNSLLAVMRRTMMLKLRTDGEDADERMRKNHEIKRKLSFAGHGDAQRDETLAEAAEDNLVGQHIDILHL